MRWVLMGMACLSLGCSGDDSQSESAAGPTMSSSGTTSSSGGATGGLGTSTSGGGSSSSTPSGPSVTTGQVDPNTCPLQGEFQGASEHSLSEAACALLPNYSTIYNLSIEGNGITITQYVENYPMTGTIDADCNVSVQLSSPLVREFQLTLDPSAMTGSGTYVEGTSSGCRGTYDISMTLMPGHA